jgi:hypothetical protein
MIREIFTLVVDKIPMPYYIRFEKDRQRFHFQASLKNKSAPSFVVIVSNENLITEPPIDDAIAKQAVQKVKEIVQDKIFDRL